MLHPLLARQLRRLGISTEAPPAAAAWVALLDRISKTYRESDEGRYLLDRSLTLTSEEMRTLNSRLVASKTALQAERDQLQATFSSLADGVCVLDLQGRCQLLNPAAEALSGVRRDQALHRPLAEFARGIDFDPRAVVDAVLAVDEARLQRSDGKSRMVSYVVAPIRSGDSPLGFVLVVRDITARLQLEIELRRAQKVESVGRLAAGVAHEINTPLQFVNDSIHFIRNSTADLERVIAHHRTACQSILEGHPSAEAAQAALAVEQEADLAYVLDQLPKAIERSLDGLGRVTAIVRSMKEFAHPDQREMAAVDLNNAVRNTLTIARNEYKHVAELEIDLGDIPPVLCHAGDVNQAVLNVVVNAAHAISDVVKDSETKGRMTVRTYAEGDWVVISIADTGSGISEAIRDRIFDPFFTTKGVGKGSGQGLALARSVIVDRHGGEIAFSTEVGRGSTFLLRLPVNGKDSKRETAHRPTASEPALVR